MLIDILSKMTSFTVICLKFLRTSEYKFKKEKLYYSTIFLKMLLYFSGRKTFREQDEMGKERIIYLFQEILLNKSLRKFLELKEWI